MAKSEASGEVRGIHQATPAVLRLRCSRSVKLDAQAAELRMSYHSSMAQPEPSDERVDQFIVYGAFGEVMHQFQVFEMTLWGFLTRSIKAARRLTRRWGRSGSGMQRLSASLYAAFKVKATGQTV
jgi:hypothetical protein